MIKVNFSADIDVKQANSILAEIRQDKMGGWLELPRKYDMGEFARVKAKELIVKKNSLGIKVVVS